jgi:hypothetical protein
MLKVITMASPTTLPKTKAKRKRQQQHQHQHQQVDIDMGGTGDGAVFDMNSTITIGGISHRQEQGRMTTGGFEVPVTKEERKRRMDRKVRRMSSRFFCGSAGTFLKLSCC